MAVDVAARPPQAELRCPRCGAFFGYPRPQAKGADLRCYRCGHWFPLDVRPPAR